MVYQRSFTFDQGSLGLNLDTMEEKVHHFISTDLDAAAARGEVEMKTEAPWRDRTTAARSGLWADADSLGSNYKLYMGHAVEYGIYLEKSNDGKFQIVMPTLIATAHAFMESLTGMLDQLDNPSPILGAIEPNLSTQRGTSQGASEHGRYVKGATEKTANKPRVLFRNAKGQFVSTKNVKVGTGHTKSTAKTTTTNRTRRG